MSLLTNEEIDSCLHNIKVDDRYGFARAIESAVLAKLNSAEPVPDQTMIECVAGAISKHINHVLYQREVIAAAQYIVHRYCHPPAPSAVEGWMLVPTEIIDRFPEINPSNYDHDDACALNAWGVELVLAAARSERDEHYRTT